MKNIVIIPVRGGSKRLPNKNILLLGEITLLVHSIRYALANTAFVDAVYVSTDDAEIKAIALANGAIVVDRPMAISGDLEPTVTALKHVLETIEDTVDNVILLQATNPLRPKNLLKEALDNYKKNNYDSLFTVSRNYHKLGKINSQKFEPYNYVFGQRSQDIEPLFYENGLLYITKASLILENKIISENAYPMEVKHIVASVDIDTLEDLEYAEYIYQKTLKTPQP